MVLHIDYITDQKGNTKSVIIPNKEWERLCSDLEKTKNKLNILLGIQDAMNEVKSLQGRKKKAKTLSDFLNEI
jgi:hypothetical protein